MLNYVVCQGGNFMEWRSGRMYIVADGEVAHQSICEPNESISLKGISSNIYIEITYTRLHLFVPTRFSLE